MNSEQYRFKFYFNASHAIYLYGEKGEEHPHTWEVILTVMKVSETFVIFNEIEKMIEVFLSKYQNVFINSVYPFVTLNPTLENICNFFREKIQDMLYEKGWMLLSIELSETPSRSYIISLADQYETVKDEDDIKTEESLQELVDKLADQKIKTLTSKRSASPIVPTRTKEKAKSKTENAKGKVKKKKKKKKAKKKTLFAKIMGK